MSDDYDKRRSRRNLAVNVIIGTLLVVASSYFCGNSTQQGRPSSVLPEDR